MKYELKKEFLLLHLSSLSYLSLSLSVSFIEVLLSWSLAFHFYLFPLWPTSSRAPLTVSWDSSLEQSISRNSENVSFHAERLFNCPVLHIVPSAGTQWSL